MELICKFQPHRNLHLQGFDDYGAAAALWGASDTGFTVSGVFRDMADFAVLVLFQKDDPFGHPLFSYLPDGDLTGLVLEFDVTWQGIQSWESLKSAWTDWNTLDYSINGVGHTDVKWIGTPGITITCKTPNRTGASATFTLNMNNAQAGDKVTLWYQSQSFISPAIVAGNPTTDQAMWWQGSVGSTDQAMWWHGNGAYNHWVKVGSATYSCLEDSLNSAGVANNIAGQINASDPNCSCSTGGAYGNEIFISLRSGKYGPVVVSSSDGSGGATLSNYQHWVKIGAATYSCYEGSLNSAQIAANVAGQINASDPNCTATVGGQYNNEILITLKAGVAGPIAVSSSDGSATATLTQGTDAATVLTSIAGQINRTDWVQNGPVVLSAAVVLPNQLVVTAAPGADGNMVAFYQTDNNISSRLYVTAANWNLSGGSSDNVSWHVKIGLHRPWLEQRGQSLVDHCASVAQRPGLPTHRMADGGHQLEGDQQSSRQARVERGGPRLGARRGGQHLGQHLGVLGTCARQRSGDRRLRVLEPGTRDPGGRSGGKHHYRNALPGWARHLRLHAARYQLRHRGRHVGRWHTGNPRLLLSPGDDLPDPPFAVSRHRRRPAQGCDHA